MTLDELNRIALLYGPLCRDGESLRSAVLAYVAQVREAEKGLTVRQAQVLALWETHRSANGR